MVGDGIQSAEERKPARDWKWLWQRFILWLAMRIATRLQKMPRPAMMRFGERLGGFVYFMTRYFFRRPQNYARRNLRITQFPHPEMTRQETDAFIRKVLVHFSKFAVELICGPALTQETMLDLVQSEGLEHLITAREQGKGIVMVSAHFGNWEMMGRYAASQGFPMTVVARETENPDFAEYIRSLREFGGYHVMYRGSNTVRELLRILKRKGYVGLLPDQNSGDMFAPFFGVPAGTVAGPASFSLHTGATLIPVFCVRLPDDTYRVIILPPIDTHSTGDKNADTQRVMEEVNRVLESVIRQYPEQWLWIHNRWKSAFEEGNRKRAFPNGLPEDLRQRWEGK